MGESFTGDDGRAASGRREFIRRGALALGVGVWAVPVVQMVRSRRPGGAQEVDTGPDMVALQGVVGACTACEVACGSVTICGSTGIFDCFCAPSADPYPLANCICASDVFCDEAIPCSAGCPDGWACATGCCGEPVCLPPCDAVTPAAPASGLGDRQGGARLTVSGKRL